MSQHWWVNQKQSYAAEREHGILWAPYLSSNGVRRYFWDTMDELVPGDHVLHYSNGHVVAISTITAPAERSPRPASLSQDLWESDGRLAYADYQDIVPPVARDEIPLEWRRSESSDGPFQVNAGVKIGYLFPLSDRFFQQFVEEFLDGFALEEPAETPWIPAEARTGAHDLLRRLIGLPLKTIMGRNNRILALKNDHALVATDRSPQGQRVPVADVERALSELISKGEVAITPEAVGYRSAFVGAVLSTLPGVQAETDPPTVRFREPEDAHEEPLPPPAADLATGLTFQGDLTHDIYIQARGEQQVLRKHLFGDSLVGRCSLCGRDFPVRFLWAAHIKKRSACSDDERRDLSNVAMAACVFGCDALYESGYLTVDPTGHVQATTEEVPAPLRDVLETLHGLPCERFDAFSSGYFQWHRNNIWRG